MDRNSKFQMHVGVLDQILCAIMALVNKEGKSKSPLIVQLAPLKRALPSRRGDWGGIMHIYDRSGICTSFCTCDIITR
jgi:hypothetical protein